MRTILSLLTFGIIALCAPIPAVAADTAVVIWNEAALEEVRNAKFGPPVVARILGIAHTCMYEAWVPYDRRAVGTVLGGTLRRPRAEHTDANKAEAISFAAFRCLSNLFTSSASAVRLREKMEALGYDPDDASVDVTTPAGIGNVAAAAVIEDRRHDGSNQYADVPGGDPLVPYSDYTGYVPVNDPLPYCLPTGDEANDPDCLVPPLPAGTGAPYVFQVDDPLRWQPLIGPPGLGSKTQTFIAPHWGLVRPFALRSGDQFDHLVPTPEVQRNRRLYRKNAEEILRFSRELTHDQKVIVEYWADGPSSEFPAGHWGLLAQFVSRRDRHTIDQDVKMFFAMHNASMDAGIVGWHIKRKYDGVRPITAIRLLKQGRTILAYGGPGTGCEGQDPCLDPQPSLIPGERWMPYNPGSNLSPAFAAYVSGHAMYSAASARVLQLFTGSDRFGFSITIPACDPDFFDIDFTKCFGRVEPGIPAVDTTLSFPRFSDAAQQASDSRLFGGIHFVDDCTVGLEIGTLVGDAAWVRALQLFRGHDARGHGRGHGHGD